MGVKIQSINSVINLPDIESDYTYDAIGENIATKVSMSGKIKTIGRRQQSTYSVKFDGIRHSKLIELRDFLLANCMMPVSVTGIKDIVLYGYIVTNPISISWDSVGEHGSASFTLIGEER